MKKLTALLLSLAMLFAMVACGGNTANNSANDTKNNASNSSDSAQDEIPETRIVTDVWNREVEIPSTVESIVCVGSMAPRFAAYLDVVDMMVGAEDIDMGDMTILYDYHPAYHEQLKALPSVGAGGGSGANNAYAEQLIQVMPDVILAGFSAEAADELQRQTGIPVVSVRYRINGFIDESFYDVLRLFADVVGAQERCEEVLAYVDTCKADLDERTKDIPDSDKLRAYTGAVTFSGRHGFNHTYVNFPPFDAVNALNVADEFLESQIGDASSEAVSSGTAFVGSNGFEIDSEQVIAWDPDIIFLDPGNMDLVNDEYAANPGFFNSLRAVEEGLVYTMPSSNYAGANITYLIMNAYYAGTVLYPEQFADVDMAEKGGEIMEAMLGMDFYDQMQDGGLYYGTITIGQ